MAGSNVEISILFADVCGSTRLYDALGDAKAKKVIGECIDFMTEVVHRHDGVVIKTIGDEVMCRFPSADTAVGAACDIQKENEDGLLFDGETIRLRVGFHHGPAILEENGDVFGDAVNLAARMAGIANARKVITTGDTMELFSDPYREMARVIGRESVKGKAPLQICEVVWEQEDVTRIVTLKERGVSGNSVMTLTYEGQEHRISPEQSGLTLGRGNNCDIVVAAPLASRLHCRMEYGNGKFVLIDNSTNGTFVKTQEGKNLYFRRESFNLFGTGMISLGEEAEEGGAHVINFSCPT